MGETKIEWTDYSCNLWIGCHEVATGCDNCYAKAMSKRFSKIDTWEEHGPRMEVKSWEENLFRWQRAAEEEDEIKRVFVGSMMDVFEKDMPLINRQGEGVEGLTTESLRSRLFRYLEQDAFPNLEFQLLTKRPQNIKNILPWWGLPDNVMIGSSISQEKDIDSSLLPLLAAPFKGRRFVSVEPLVGDIYLGSSILERLDWVIIGGESGPNARPMHPVWASGILNVCEMQGVPVFFKQWGEWREVLPNVKTFAKPSVWLAVNGERIPFEAGWPGGETIEDFVLMEKVGRERTGSLVGGKQYHQFVERSLDAVFSD